MDSSNAEPTCDSPAEDELTALREQLATLSAELIDAHREIARYENGRVVMIGMIAALERELRERGGAA